MHRHSFETYQVLRRIDGLSDIALWAAYHHETPDGSGYPFRRHGDDLSPGGTDHRSGRRVSGLAQHRPYRQAMPVEDIVLTLGRFVAAGKLDPQVVALVEANLDKLLPRRAPNRRCRTSCSAGDDRSLNPRRFVQSPAAAPPVPSCSPICRAGAQGLPDVIENPWLRRCTGVDPVGLHQFPRLGDAFEKERHQGDFFVLRQIQEDAVELLTEGPCHNWPVP